MEVERIAHRWFLAAIPYFLLSVALGVYMGASGDHALFTVHSHASLLGWVSMALMGLLYRAFPAAATHRLVAWQFYLYQIGLPVMLLAVGAIVLGMKGAEPFAGIASVSLLVSVTMFSWVIFATRDRG
jgi:cbb3-type cytochrome oxidase subunit 1